MTIFEVIYATCPPVRRILSFSIGFAWGAFYVLRSEWLMFRLRRGARITDKRSVAEKLAFPRVDGGENN